MTLRDYERGGVITVKEHDILELRAAGFSQRRVAQALDLSRSTVRDVEARAWQKIRLHETKEAA